MNSFLKDLKSEYKKTNATLHLRMSGWDDVAEKIGIQEPLYKRFIYSSFAKFSLAFVVVLIFFLGTYGSALASLPGDPLYSVKVLSERVIHKITGSNQVAIDHRAQEIVILAQQKEIKSQELEYASVQYAQVVSETKQEIKDTGRSNPKFEQNLKLQHQEFDRLVKDNPHVESDIKDAQDSSDHGGD